MKKTHRLFNDTNHVFSRVKKALRLLVASSDGYLYMYSFDEVLGGNCTLLKKFQLTEPDGTITAGSEERPANMVEFGNGVKVNGGTTGIGVDSATGKIKIMTKDGTVRTVRVPE